MSDPTYPINCLQGQWTPVAINVLSGQIFNMDKSAFYFQTYRLTGEAAPTNSDEGAQIFTIKNFEIISQKINEPIDVYIWCKNNDGIVRVDV